MKWHLELHFSIERGCYIDVYIAMTTYKIIRCDNAVYSNTTYQYNLPLPDSTEIPQMDWQLLETHLPITERHNLVDVTWQSFERHKDTDCYNIVI